MSTSASDIDVEQLPSSRALGIAGVLRKRLNTGVYQPGQWLRESGLRDEFGVSNGPIREALQLLAADGLLERIPQRGIRVIDLSHEEIIQLMQLRVALLELGCELAALRHDEDDLIRLPKLTGPSRDPGSETPQITGHVVNWIFAAARNPRLTQTWARTQAQARLYIQKAANSARESWPDLVEQAQGVLDAIIARDAARARQGARTLTRNFAARLDIDIGI